MPKSSKTKTDFSKLDIYSHINDLFAVRKTLDKEIRLVLLLKLEINRIIDDINTKKDILYKLWSKERTREPLISVLKSRFYDLSFTDLMFLEKDLNVELDRFYRALSDFKFYVTYTEDMPQTMKNTFNMHFKSLNLLAIKLLNNLSKKLKESKKDKH